MIKHSLKGHKINLCVDVFNQNNSSKPDSVTIEHISDSKLDIAKKNGIKTNTDSRLDGIGTL